MPNGALLLIAALCVVGAAGAHCPDGASMVPCRVAHRKVLATAPAPAPQNQQHSSTETDVREHKTKGSDDYDFGWDDGVDIGVAAGEKGIGGIYDNYYVPKNPIPDFSGSYSASRSSARLGTGAIVGIVCGVAAVAGLIAKVIFCRKSSSDEDD